MAIVVSERGIAQARNALVEHVLAHSRAEFIAMLDDDEWPSPDWLEAFLRAQRETGADALRGTILREFETVPGAWAAKLQGIAPVRARSGPIPMIDGAGNVMIARRCFEGLTKPFFDPAFALTGGEDRDFFTRLRQAGRRFAWADEAVCTEFVPASRANLGWALNRAYRIGNSDMRVFLKYTPAWFESACAEGAKIAGAIASLSRCGSWHSPLFRNAAPSRSASSIAPGARSPPSLAATTTNMRPSMVDDSAYFRMIFPPARSAMPRLAEIAYFAFLLLIFSGSFALRHSRRRP